MFFKLPEKFVSVILDCCIVKTQEHSIPLHYVFSEGGGCQLNFFKLKFILKMVGNDKYDVGLLSKCWGGSFGALGGHIMPLGEAK